MIKRRGIDHDFIGIIFLILFALVMIWQSLRLELGTFRRPGSGLFPLFTALTIGILCLTYLCWKMLTGSGVPLRLKLGPNWRKALCVIIVSILYVAIFWNTLGYILSTSLWLFILFRIGDLRSWKKSILIPIVIAISSYFLLEKVVFCNLPAGMFGF